MFLEARAGMHPDRHCFQESELPPRSRQPGQLQVRSRAQSIGLTAGPVKSQPTSGRGCAAAASLPDLHVGPTGRPPTLEQGF